MSNYSDMYKWLYQEWSAIVGKKRIIKPRFWVFMIATLVLVFTCVYVSQGQFLIQQSSRIEELELERTAQMNENALLERKIAFTKTDEYVERIAHAELGLLKEGETRFVAGGQSNGD